MKKILNFGSLNMDFVYAVAHTVRGGETEASLGLQVFPGGKGLNQSIAAARAGLSVFHAGLVGEDGGLLLDTLKADGVDTRFVGTVPGRSGHTIIQVDENAQNAILLFGGANRAVTPAYADEVLAHFSAGDIVLLRTDADDRWGKPEYLVAGAGMSYEATMWLLNQGVRVVGTDGWSWDVPLPFEGQEFEKNHDASIIWEAHRVGRDKAYFHIEKLTNLDQLPVTGFKVNCFPVSIKAASAGWARVVAFVE